MDQQEADPRLTLARVAKLISFVASVDFSVI
jgi:hypothetical protein